MQEPELMTLPLMTVKPYWRNPRDNRATGAKVLEVRYPYMGAVK